MTKRFVTLFQIFSLFRACLHLFSKRDQFLLLVFLAIQISLSLLDIVGVLLVAAVVAVAVSAVRGSDFPNWVSRTVEVLQLENISPTNIATLFGICAAFLFISKSLLSLFLQYRSQRFIAAREIMLTERVSKLFLDQDLLNLSSFNQSQYQHTLTLGINAVMSGVMGQTISLVSELSLQFAMLILLSTFSFEMTIAITLYFLLVFLILNSLQGKYSRNLGKKITEEETSSFTYLSDYLKGYREILVSGKTNYFIKLFSDSRASTIELQVKKNLLTQVSKYVFEIAFVVAGLGVSAYSFVSFSAEHAASLLAVFLTAISRVSTSILRLQYGYVLLQGFLGSTELFFRIYNRVDSLREESYARISNLNLKGKSTFENLAIAMTDVQFGYPSNSKFNIHSLNMLIEPNSSIALVGPSGGGKSTIADLIIGALKPSHGFCEIYGNDPSSLHSWKSSGIAYVPQEVHLLSGSIIQNVAIGEKNSEIDKERVMSALHEVKLLSHFLEFPEGLETKISQNGLNMSGGQKQRIGIARALYRNPSILILDEATSALDAQLEDEISKVFRALKGKLTLVIIAHRLSTVMSCDTIFYIDNGRIVDFGTFSELRSRIKNFDTQAQLMGIPE